MTDTLRGLTPDKDKVNDITKRWMACPVRRWNTSCQDEKICIDPEDPKCPKNSDETEIIYAKADNQNTQSN
jgi:hypothetical protein